MTNRLIVAVLALVVVAAAIAAVRSARTAGTDETRPRRVNLAASPQTNAPPARGPFADYRSERPGVAHHIRVSELPPPFATKSVANFSAVMARPSDAWPKGPTGFQVQLYATKLGMPRLIRTAPNGDLFLAESGAGRVRVFRGIDAQGKPEREGVFASDLNQPFGIAFYPPGDDPQWVYVAETGRLVRFPYKNGDLHASGPPQVIIPTLPTGGHWTRDVVFSLDGKRMFVAVGSASNVDDPDTHPGEFHRANILQCNPDGTDLHVYAYGIRNPVSLAVQPTNGALWTSVNERDDLGDNLPPDYITHVEDGGFYGWPWFYMGNHQDPRHARKHPELADKVIVPDILIQPHNASLQMTFYNSTATHAFPQKYRGGIFASEHGSWNRSVRTGYEVIFAPLDAEGHATGEYQDFVTGFVTDDGRVWGRPVGVTTAPDGSLLFTDDGSGSVWRVLWAGT